MNVSRDTGPWGPFGGMQGIGEKEAEEETQGIAGMNTDKRR
jgi:hypothetical protein